MLQSVRRGSCRRDDCTDYIRLAGGYALDRDDQDDEEDAKNQKGLQRASLRIALAVHGQGQSRGQERRTMTP
jgi:hypothetical protein